MAFFCVQYEAFLPNSCISILRVIVLLLIPNKGEVKHGFLHIGYRNNGTLISVTDVKRDFVHIGHRNGVTLKVWPVVKCLAYFC